MGSSDRRSPRKEAIPRQTCSPAAAEIEEQRDKEILGEWKKHPGRGPSQIRNQLRARCVKVSVNTVRRVMDDAGYRPPKVQRRPHDQSFVPADTLRDWMRTGPSPKGKARSAVSHRR